jgi:GTPase SAR1 family protein
LELITEARRLTHEGGLAPLDRELQVLAGRLLGAARRLVVIGEESRGKTVLINRLIGAALLDSSPTAEVTMIAQSPPSSPENLRHVQVRNPLIDGLFDEVIDTPGIGGEYDAGSVVRPLAMTASALILVVAGTSALSLSERAILEEISADQVDDSLVIAVSMLDRVDPLERSAVIESVTRKAKRIASHVEVVDAADLDELRRVLARGASRESERRAEWDTQTAIMLRRLVDGIVAVATGRLEQERVAELADSSANEVAEARRRRQALEWEAIAIEIETRKQSIRKRLAESLKSSSAKTQDRLEADLRASPNPQQWWQDSMRRLLQYELESTSRRLERRLAETLDQDLTWLSDEVDHMVDVRPLILRPDAFGIDTAREYYPLPGTPNVARLKQGTLAAAVAVFAANVAMQGATVAVFPPAALAGATYVAGTVITKGGLRRAQNLETEAMKAGVSECFERLEGQVMQAVESAYTHLAGLAAQLQDDWRSSYRPPTTSESHQGGWHGILERANVLARELPTSRQRGTQ